MPGKFYKSGFALHIVRLMGCFCLGILFTALTAQAATGTDPRCFAINVRLNGQSIAGPQSVTLKTSKVENTVQLDQTCFKVPEVVLQSELIEVSFTVPGSNIHMSDLPADFLNGMWDVDLADKKFGKEVVVPKHASAGEVCALVVRSGGTEQSFAQPQCRTPLAAK